jgi:toxin FitB
MRQLIVRRVEEKIVNKLKKQAGLHGVSMEEEHRRILKNTLLPKHKKRSSLKEYLRRMPDFGEDELFEHVRFPERRVDLWKAICTDTNIVSEVRKGKRANSNVQAWLDSVEDEALFLSVLVLGKIRKDIERARTQDSAKARALERWLVGLERTYGDRILPVNVSIADRWGRLSAVRPIDPVDGLLAATALIHNLTLVTRNVIHAAHTGVKILNPFGS